jgi:hypothetical protein
LWHPSLAKRAGGEKIDRYDSMDALGEVYGVILNPGKLGLHAFWSASRRNVESMGQMTNVKAQSSNEIQISNDQNDFWHLDICH